MTAAPRPSRPGRGAGDPRRAAGRLAAAALLLGAALLDAPAARAEPRAAPLPATVTADRGRLTARLDLAAAFPEEAVRRLGNGLTNVVAVLVAVVPAGGGAAVAVTGRVVEVLYDVWDEDYTVTVRDAGRPQGERRAVGDAAALRRLLADERPLDLGPLDLLPPGPFRLEVRVEVNPVSHELMERTRELLANPAHPGRPGAGSRSVLGAMASYLLREPATGDDVVLLRSRPFTPTEVGPP